MGHVQVGTHETKPIVIFVIVGRPMDLKIWIKFGLACRLDVKSPAYIICNHGFKYTL